MAYARPMKKLPLQMRWGKENEERARKCYIESRKDVAGELIEVLPTTFWITSDAIKGIPWSFN